MCKYTHTHILTLVYPSLDLLVFLLSMFIALLLKYVTYISLERLSIIQIALCIYIRETF